jgi:hypothetical protein
MLLAATQFRFRIRILPKGDALHMAHEARKNSTNPTILRLAREIIIAQRKEIIELRNMLQSQGFNKPAYYTFDSLFLM